MSESQLKLYSLGIVTEDKQRNSDYIKVTPIESLPLQSGPINQQVSQYNVSLPDSTGVKRAHQVTGDNHVVAKWIQIGSNNRITAPDVYHGETVSLYRYADTDEYYWTTMFREPSLRKKETVLYGYSNQSGKGNFDKSSSYWAEVSTHDKHIHIHTSNNDGEPYGYDILLDTSTGKLTIADTIGNKLELDSSSSSINLTTNTSVNIKSPTVSIEASDIKLKGNIAIDGDINSTGQATFAGNVNAPNNQM